jgi:plasmid stabilization system protein ParE
MIWELQITSEAERCIEEQVQWYEADRKHGGPELACRWVERLERLLDHLCQHPERHGFAPENGRWMAHLAIRQIRFKPWTSPSAWRVLYVIMEDSGQVVVLQIRHERRPLLFEGEDT